MADAINPEQLASEAASGVDIPALEQSAQQPYQAPNFAPQSETTQAPAQASGSVNVLNPQGDLVSIDSAQLQDALAQGYKQAAPEAIKQHFEEEKYGGAGQGAIAGAEAIGRGLAGLLAPMAERAAGVNPEGILKREQYHPIISGTGETAGLIVGALTGSGEARALELAGEAGVKALGMEAGTAALSKIGSAAVKSGIEGLVLGGSDEMSKAVMQDPGQTLGSAAINVGLTGLLGGAGGAAFGAVNPLWSSTMGPKLEGYLGSLSKHLNGEPLALPETIEAASKELGVSVDPVLRSGMSSEAMANQFNILREMKKPEVLEPIERLENESSQKLMNATGLDPNDVKSYSEAETGRAGMQSFKQELEAKYQPIAKAYEEIKAPRMNSELPEGVVTRTQTPETVNNPYVSPQYSVTKSAGLTDTLADRVANMANESGYATEGTPHAAIVNSVTKDLASAKTVQDLANISTKVNNLTKGFANSHLWDLRGKISSILEDGQHLGLSAALADKAPELIDKLEATNQAYKQYKGVLNELSANLGLGHPGGHKGFLEALENKVSPESFLRKLSPKGNAEIIPFLQREFPTTLSSVRNNELMQIIKSSVAKGTEDRPIDLRTLQTALRSKSSSPELKSFALPPGFENKVTAAQTLKDAIPAFKSSGTAGWIAQLQSKLPASAMAAAAALTGHNPVIGFVLGHMGQLLSRDVPDAIRLATLKFLGSGEAINAPGFKAMVDYLHNAIRGEAALSKAAKGVFSRDKDVLSEGLMSKESDRVKLDNTLKKLQSNPQLMTAVGDSETFHYLPEVAQELGQVTGQAVPYLNNLRPKPIQLSPLDTKIPPTLEQKAQYNRALDVAVQPLSIIDRVKEGSLTPQDVIHLQTIYPKLYPQICAKLTSEMQAKVAKGELIPYHIRQGMSILTGQPMDSTMTPQAIIAAQPIPPTQQGQQSTGGAARGSKGAFKETAGRYQTQDQAAEQRKNKQ